MSSRKKQIGTTDGHGCTRMGAEETTRNAEPKKLVRGEVEVAGVLRGYSCPFCGSFDVVRRNGKSGAEKIREKLEPAKMEHLVCQAARCGKAFATPVMEVVL